MGNLRITGPEKYYGGDSTRKNGELKGKRCLSEQKSKKVDINQKLTRAYKKRDLKHFVSVMGKI